MINYIGCIIALMVGFVLSNVSSIDDKQIKIITILGWVIALSFAKANQGGF